MSELSVTYRGIVYYVYLLRSIKHPEISYVGYTTNLKQRLETHNSGGSIYTKDARPWELVAFVGLKDKYRAIELEHYFKTCSGKSFAAKRLL